MVDLQTLVATSPPGGSIDYRIDIPVAGGSPDLEVRATLPDGTTIRQPIADGAVRLEQSHGQGVWRTVADIVAAADESTVLQSVTVDTVILDESDEGVRDAVGAALGLMTASYPAPNAALNEGNARDKALGLSRELAGVEVSEILRQLVFEGTSDPTIRLRQLLLLKECSNLPGAKPLRPLILAVISSLLGTEKDRYFATVEFGIIVSIPLPPAHKWFYFLHLFGKIESRPLGTHPGPAEVAEQLTRMTPPEYRSLVLQVAEERLELDTGFVRHLGNLYKRFSYRGGLAKLLDVLEVDQSNHWLIFDLFLTFDYREATERVRALFPFCAGDHILNLLCSWKDVASVPLIFDRLEGVYNEPEVRGIVARLGLFGDPSLVSRLDDVASRSPANKAAWIRAALKTWQ